MICPRCKKEYETPLLLNNGAIACPVCFEELVNTNLELTVNSENQKLYKLSESAFLRGIKDSNTKLIDRAIELCERACEEKNLFAYLKMGYYYENNLVGEGTSKVYRTLMAYEYYMTVLNCKLSSEDFGERVDIAAIKKETAQRVLNILSDFPEGASINKKYSAKYNYDRFVSNGYTDLIFENDLYDLNSVLSKTVLAKEVDEMNKRKSNIILAAYVISGRDIKDMLETKKEDNPFYIASNNSRISLKYGSYSSGYINVSNNQQYKTFKTNVLNNLNERFNIIVFNKNLSLKYFNQSNGENIKKYIYDDSHAINEIMKFYENKESFEFYEDDIYFANRSDKINSNIASKFSEYMKRGDLIGYGIC